MRSLWDVSLEIVFQQHYTHKYCQPPQPLRPRICRIPAASNDPKMLQKLSAVQNQASRVGSSFDLKK